MGSRRMEIATASRQTGLSHASKPNLSGSQRRVLYLTYNRASDGNHRAGYCAEKRLSFPPDIDRLAGVECRFRV
jgi:hypothetical protein